MSREELKCPNCGAQVYATDNRCVSCGTMLDAGQLLAVPDPEEATREEDVEPEGAEPGPRAHLYAAALQGHTEIADLLC